MHSCISDRRRAWCLSRWLEVYGLDSQYWPGISPNTYFLSRLHQGHRNPDKNREDWDDAIKNKLLQRDSYLIYRRKEHSRLALWGQTSFAPSCESYDPSVFESSHIRAIVILLGSCVTLNQDQGVRATRWLISRLQKTSHRGRYASENMKIKECFLVTSISLVETLHQGKKDDMQPLLHDHATIHKSWECEIVRMWNRKAQFPLAGDTSSRLVLCQQTMVGAVFRGRLFYARLLP